MRRRDDGSYIYSPSDLNLFFESPFASWMERFQAESAAASGVKASRGDKDAQAQLIAERGLAHEKAYLDSLIAAGRDVCVIDPDADPLTATERAMRDGREIIFQGALRRTDDGILFQGLSDFLFRTDEPSPRLRWTYEVADTKLARKPKPYFLLQLCAYAEMLEAIQGCRPANVYTAASPGGGKGRRGARPPTVGKWSSGSSASEYANGNASGYVRWSISTYQPT